MRNAEFNVPPEVITEFVAEMTNRNLSNCIIGTTEDDEIIIEVEYEKIESDAVDELEEILNKLSADIEQEEEEEEE
jgi:capsular polysaccharide biosynthesis protein